MNKLFYVIGASGAGKDTLMDYARSHIQPNDKVLFAHRYITRPALWGNENHVSLTEQEFKARLDGGLFLMHWQSHHNWYGIGIEINLWLDKGFNVVVNGSREYLATAKTIYPELIIVLIVVSPDVLLERLVLRGREDEEEIKKRVQRTNDINVAIENCVRIENNHTIEMAGNELVKVISTCVPD